MAQVDITEYADLVRNNPYWDHDKGELHSPAYASMGYGGKYRFEFTKITPARRIARETDLIKLIRAGEEVRLVVSNGHVDKMTANFAGAILEEVYKVTGSTKALDLVDMAYGDLNNKRKKFKRKVLAKLKPTTWSKPQQMMIPDIGTVIKLTEDWTFNLYHESRNGDLYERMWRYENEGWRVGGRFDGKLVKHDKVIEQVTILKGAELKIDRVYIRKGGDEYSSITFYADKGAEFKAGKKRLSLPTRRIRFWAKLGDVNGIRCSVNEATVRTDG